MIRLRPSARCSGTRSLIASARRDEVGVIHPNLPWLTRLNSHPINADRYPIDWRGLLGPPFKTGLADARCCLSSIEDPHAQYRGLLRQARNPERARHCGGRPPYPLR
jgi:hypothetical protein